MHNKAMLLFKQYLLVGRMPKPVVLFIESGKNFSPVDAKKRDILNLYRNDIMKIKSQYRSKILAIFDQIPRLLSQHEKRIVFKDIQEGSFSNQYDIEIDFLISNNSKLKYKLFPIEVKSSKNYTTTSLLRFKEKFKQRLGECYIIHPKNLCTKDDVFVLCIPPYMAMCL